MWHLILKVSLHMSYSIKTTSRTSTTAHSIAQGFAGLLTFPLWRAVQQGYGYAKRKCTAVHDTSVVSTMLP